MSDDQGATPEPEATPAEPEAPRNEDAPRGDAGQKALEAFKSRAKEAEKQAKELAAQLEARDEAEKSELEKAQGKLSKAEKAAAEATAKLLRFEVANDLEVPAKLVPLLTARDREGLEMQANLILENAKTAPAPNFDGGAREAAPEPVEPGKAHNALLLQLAGIEQNT